MKEPRCNHPHDHECYKNSHARNTSRNPLSLYGRECPVHGPTAREAATMAEKNICKDCGISYGGHAQDCKQNPQYKPPPPPDPYVSPHSVNAEGEQPIRIPVFEEVPAYVDGVHVLKQTGFQINYPHHTWINARESYARGSDTLENMLQYVTETNPPPGPPIAVYKPAPVETHHSRTWFYAAFGLLFCLVGLFPLIAMLFG